MACSAFAMLSFTMLAAAPARADDLARASRSLQVKLTDLDLSTGEGRRVADERLRQTARVLCSRVADELDLSHHENYIKCIDSALASAGAQLQAKLNQQALSTLAQADMK